MAGVGPGCSQGVRSITVSGPSRGYQGTPKCDGVTITLLKPIGRTPENIHHGHTWEGNYSHYIID